MSITIKDIARQAGVSHSTVSRALRHSPLISDNTINRIENIALELGYYPSAVARSLKTNRSQVWGVIVSHISDPYFSEVLQGIDDIAQKNGYSLFIASAQQDSARENAIVRAMHEHRVDGIILCSPFLTLEQSKLINSYGIPIVALNNQAAECFQYEIYHDDVDGSKQACEHLIGLGHKRIAYLGNAISGQTNEDRLSGFKQAMSAANIPIMEEYLLQAKGNSADEGLEAVASLISLKEKPTAVICYNDWIAVGVLKGLQQAGIQVPDDISVTGFDNIQLSNYTRPTLTTIDQPKRFLGAEAARLMLEQLGRHRDGDEKKSIRLKGLLVIRQSTVSPHIG